MPQYVYKLCLILLVLFLSSYSIELSFLTSIMVILFTASNRVNKSFLQGVLLVFAVASIGVISSYEAFKHDAYNVIKDAIYFIRPITILFASYYVIKRIKNLNFVFNTVVVISLIYSLLHLFLIIINIDKIDSYVAIRTIGGKQNHIEIVALIFLLFTPYVTVFKGNKRLLVFFLSLSFILYFSRTMFIVLFIYFLGYKGYLFLNKKILKGMFVFAIVALVLGIIISSVDTDRDSTGLKKFIYKTQNSFTELFQTVESDKIRRDQRQLWEHWRAFEAQKAIEQVNNKGVKAWFIGLGYGPQVELGRRVKLDGKFFTELPSIHNGYIFVLFKTGLIGLLFYLAFIFYAYVKYQRFRDNTQDSIFNKLIVATSLYVFFNSFVITGFYRPGEFSLFLFAILIASKEKLLITNNRENHI